VSSGWNKEPPGPALPPEVVEGTSRRYRDCYEKLTGEEWFE
jgi:phosphoribosylaminoimidazole-succinocarboxamide synthase